MQDKQKQELIDLIVHLVEQLIQKHIKDNNKKIESQIKTLKEEIENVQDIMIKHFQKKEITHSRNHSLGDTEDTIDEHLKIKVNQDLENLNQRIIDLENMNNIILQNQQSFLTLKHIREFENRIEARVQDQIMEKCDETKQEVINNVKDKLKFQWTVINDQVERIERFRQKIGYLQK